MSNDVCKKKIVVFDLDETLGNFVELGMFWDALENFHGHKLPDQHFFELVDMFQEFLRPNILTILKFLLEKKQKGKCNSLMIYTNNQGPKSWARMISKYFDSKLGEQTFEIPTSQLYMVPKQTYTLHNQGITRINKQNIYDVTKKGHIYVTINVE